MARWCIVSVRTRWGSIRDNYISANVSIHHMFSINSTWGWIDLNCSLIFQQNGAIKDPGQTPRQNEINTVHCIPPLQRSFTLSVCPSIRLFVCGQNRIRSVISTILAAPFSYLHIISNNLWRCVVHKSHSFNVLCPVYAPFWNSIPI